LRNGWIALEKGELGLAKEMAEEHVA
jgi:hypothetical protein